MSAYILMPMPTEAYLREWERGITRTLSRTDIDAHDPAFMGRESNPTMGIRIEDGAIIWNAPSRCPEGIGPVRCRLERGHGGKHNALPLAAGWGDTLWSGNLPWTVCWTAFD